MDFLFSPHDFALYFGHNDFIKGREFEEGASEARRGWEEEGKGAVEGRARLGLWHLLMLLPHPWHEAPGTD